MKRYACLAKADGAYRLDGFDDRQPLPSADGLAAVMVWRPDLAVQAIELPAMAKKEVRGFLSYRIRSLYPGQPAQTEFDYRVLALAGKRYAILFLIQRSILEEYRRVTGGRPLFPSLSLLLPLFARRRSAGRVNARSRVGLYWHEAWVEALVVREGEPPRSVTGQRGGAPAAELERILSLAKADLREADCLAVCPAGERAALRELLAPRLSGSASLTVLSAPQALRRLGRGPEPLFGRPRRRFPVPRSLRLPLYAALALLLSFLALRRTVDRDAAHLGQLRRTLQAALGRASQQAALGREVEALKARSEALRRERPPDPYRVLAELQSVLEPGTRLQAFALEGGLFQLEAVGPNPLEQMKGFEDRAMFENVKLIQIVPQPGGQELFRLTGSAHAQ